MKGGWLFLMVLSLQISFVKANDKKDTLRMQNTWQDSLPAMYYTSISDTLFYSQIIVDTNQLIMDTSHLVKIDSHAILYSSKYTYRIMLPTLRSNSALASSHWQDYIGYHKRLKMYVVNEWYITGDALGIGSLSLFDIRHGYIYPLSSAYDGACSVPVLSPNGKYMFTYDYCPDCPDEESYVSIYQINKRGISKIILKGAVQFPGEESQADDAAEINEIHWGKDGNIYIRARKFTILDAEAPADRFAGYICCAYYRIDLKQKSKPTE